MSDLQEHPLIQLYIRNNHFGNTLGMDFSIGSEGNVTYHMTIAEAHLATPVASHGGAIAGLMDAALGVASLSTVCREEKVVSTIEMTVRFLLPALLGDVLTARTGILSKGKRIIVAEARITNQKGQLVAVGSGTFNAYPKEKAGL